jgi:hypothetical protein
MENATLELIEDLIFWEKHTEIYESLEEILRKKYIVTRIPAVEEHELFQKDGIRDIISYFIGAEMDKEDNFRQLEGDVSKKFNIKKKNGGEEV